MRGKGGLQVVCLLYLQHYVMKGVQEVY